MAIETLGAALGYLKLAGRPFLSPNTRWNMIVGGGGSMAIETLGAALGYLNRLFVEGTVSGLPDDQLLDRFLATRDGAAFEMLVARHGPMVLRVCRGVLRNSSDAEDAFQTTFLVLVEKARALRGRAQLGGWLHLVAYRVAIQANAAAARRRVQERRAGEMTAITSSCDPIIPDELIPALHEEIARLPERIRLAVVLCDLQGVPQVQAAESLRLSERTLRRRLADGRERLKARLGCRGLEWSEAIMTAVRLREAGTVIPPAWRGATLRAALDLVSSTAVTGTAFATARSLTHEVLKTMFVHRLAIASAALLGAGLTTWAASAALVSSGDGPEAAPAPVAHRVAPAMSPLTSAMMKRPTSAGEGPAPATAPDGSVGVRGRVIGPDGKPVAGAIVRRAFVEPGDKPEPDAVSARDGRFMARVFRAARSASMLNGADAMPVLVASAPGFGPGWVGRVLRSDDSSERTIRLVEAGPPIEGRIVDVKGQPVAGAHVKVERLWFAWDEHSWYVETGDLLGWLRRIQDRGIDQGPWDGLGTLSTPVAGATTDADGHFRITGIGRERVAELLVSGPTIATSLIYALCHDGPEFRVTNHGIGSRQQPTVVFHAPRFEQAVAPTQPIEGIIRDKDTGRPIAGVRLQGAVYEEGTWSRRRASRRRAIVRVITDSRAWTADRRIGCSSSRRRACPIPRQPSEQRPARPSRGPWSSTSLSSGASWSGAK
jgi:RNA polymerase sigma factor (sigma-70 family)